MANIKVTGTDITSGQNKPIAGGDTIRPETGDLTVSGGPGGVGTGGSVTVVSGDGATCGTVTIYGGAATTGGVGGNISIEGGDVNTGGSGTGGTITVIGGQGGDTGTAGSADLVGGFGGSISGNGGDVSMTSGPPAQISSSSSGGAFVSTGTTIFSPPITTTKSGAQALPTATVNVASTAAFPTAGKIHFNAGSPTIQTITYTGKTATSFTGCTGGTGTLGNGATITFYSGAPTGSLTINSQDAEGTSGGIQMTTGNSTFSSTGDISLTVGTPDNSQFISAKTAPAGSIFLTTPVGRTTVFGGNIALNAGQIESATDNIGGMVILTGGGNGHPTTDAIQIATEPGTSTGESSSISIFTGDSDGEGGPGTGSLVGNIAIDNGANDGTAGNATIYIGADNATNIDIGHTGCLVTIRDLTGFPGAPLVIVASTGQNANFNGGVGTAGSGTGGQSVIQGGAGGAPNGAGGGAFALGGAGVGTGTGGPVSITAGSGGPSNGIGGGVLIDGGTGTGTALGGPVAITGGEGGNTNGTGGGILADGGPANGSGTGGAFQARGGTGGTTGVGGGIIIYGGDGGSTSGNGGSAEFYGGAAITSGVGGEVIIIAGDAAGTDQSGSPLSLASGAGTGDGAPNNVTISTTKYGVTNTTLHTFVERIYVKGAPNGLTNSAANSLFEVDLPDGFMTGVRLSWTVAATDDTDYQSRNGQIGFSAVNKGGTITNAVDAGSSSIAASTGTLTVTFTVLNGTDKVTLQVTPVSSLTTTDLFIVYTIYNDSLQALTIL